MMFKMTTVLAICFSVLPPVLSFMLAWYLGRKHGVRISFRILKDAEHFWKARYGEEKRINVEDVLLGFHCAQDALLTNILDEKTAFSDWRMQAKFAEPGEITIVPTGTLKHLYEDNG